MSGFKNNPEEMKIGQLIANLARQQAIRTDQFMEKTGLYRGQAFLLIILSDQDGLTHSEIAERLEISPAAATKVIKRMEALHYLQRRSDPADERISRVFLEDEGRAVIQQIIKVFEQVDGILLRGFSLEEQRMVFKLLGKLYLNLLDRPFRSS